MVGRIAAVTLCVTLACPCAAVAQPLSDEEDLALVYGDRATVSIATGSRQTLRRAPAVASVITAEDIAAMGATDLDEALESVAGLHVSRSSIRYASAYMIRGIGGGGQSNPQVLLLQNGIPMTTLFNGDKGVTWTGVPLENVARVEVIRGPGSALYGADAYAGVINVITRTAADAPGTEAGLRVGSFNTRSAWIQHGGQAGGMEVAAFLRVGATDGLREIVTARSSPSPGPVSTDHDAVDASLNVSRDKWRFRTSYKLRDKLGTGAGVSSALDPTSKSKTENLTGDLSWANPKLAQNWGAGATASFLHYTQVYPDNVVLLPPSGTWPTGQIGGPNQWERQFRLSGFLTYSGFSGHSLRLGLGRDDLDMYKTRTIRNYMFVGSTATYTGPGLTDYTEIQPHIRPQQRQVSYAYAQDEWRFAQDWTLTAGARRDYYSDFGGTTNPRLALVWEAAYDLTAKLLYGRAFRAPSFNEQHGINPVANGNPALKPEIIATWEAALSWQAIKNTQINLSLFRYDIRDVIRLVGTAFANSGTQHGTGMEAEATWDAGRALRLTGNYAYQKSISEATGTDAGYAPRHHLYARADWRLAPGWLLGGQVNRVADRRRATGDTRRQIDDYTTVDLTLRSDRGRKDWNFAVSVRNLFDADAREPTLAPGTAIPNDLPMAPRAVYLQATHAL